MCWLQPFTFACALFIFFCAGWTLALIWVGNRRR